jgi:hypothetical protein
MRKIDRLPPVAADQHVGTVGHRGVLPLAADHELGAPVGAVEQVVAGAAVEGVDARAAAQDVGAGAAAHRVRPGAAGQRVVERGAGQQVGAVLPEGHAAARADCQDVVALPAEQARGAGGRADQPVGAREAVDALGLAVRADYVVLERPEGVGEDRPAAGAGRLPPGDVAGVGARGQREQHEEDGERTAHAPPNGRNRPGLVVLAFSPVRAGPG